MSSLASVLAKWSRPCARISIIAAWVVQAAVLVGLTILSLLTTVTFQRNQHGSLSERTVMSSFSLFSGQTVTIICGCGVASVAVFMLAVWLSKLPRRYMFWSLLAYVFVVQIVWIAAAGLVTYAFSDSRSLIDAANFFNSGNTAAFDPSYCPRGTTEPMCVERHIPSPYAYFAYYPFQAGPMLWFALIFSIFGANNLIAFQIVNALAIVAVVAVLWRWGSFIGLDDLGYSAFAVLTMTCAPLLMFCTLVYPNVIGFFFTIIGVAIVAESLRITTVWKSAACMCAGFIVAGIGLIFKSTFQILVLAMIIAVFVAVMQSRRVRQLLVAIPSAVLSFLMSRLPIAFLEHWSGQKFGKGLPMMSWIAIGLGHPEKKAPGWWSGFALRAFHETHNDYEAQARISRDFVVGRLHDFMQNPHRAVGFFTEKLSTEWAEPSFMTTYYSQLGQSWNGYQGLSGFLLHGQGSGVFITFEDIMQTFTYGMAVIGITALIRKIMKTPVDEIEATTSFTYTFLAAAFVGGFLCFVLWEAKGIYTLPFFILLLPLCAYAVQTTSDRQQASQISMDRWLNKWVYKWIDKWLDRWFK